MSDKSERLKQQRVDSLFANDEYTFVNFKGAALLRGPGTNGFIPMTEDNFSPIAYTFGAVSRAFIMDMAHMIEHTAPDWSEYDRYVGFNDKVWDRQTLAFVEQDKYVYSTDIAVTNNTAASEKFLLQLAKGDPGLAHDYLQGMAALFMTRRPTGIIWFIGDGANGKSSLLKALYKGFGKFFTSMTTADLEDGRDIPSMRGILGNIVLEASEARVIDSRAYKSIGSHEPLRVHAFNKQTGVVVETTFHTIFNANNIPVFGDKTRAISRRTVPIPFPAKFKDDPTFEDRTFTPAFLGGMMKLILDTTVEIRDNGNKYNWSPATNDMRQQYEQSMNSAEAFLGYLNDKQIHGFFNYTILKVNYENWCSDNGLTALFMTNLKKTFTNEGGAVRRSFRQNDKVYNRYFLSTTPQDDDLTWLENGYGMQTPSKEPSIEQLTLAEGTTNEW